MGCGRRGRWLVILALGAILNASIADGQAVRQPVREVPDRVLQKQLDSLVQGFHGDVGIYVRQLRSGRTAAINADSVFPTASMIKVPILVGVFDGIATGAVDYHQSYVFRDSLRYTLEDDLMASLRDSTPVPLSQIILLMITTSDNTAALWAQALAGGGTTINGWLAANGFDSTRVNSRTPGREASRALHGWGQTTPREMADLLVAIREGRVVSRAASEQMYRALTRIYWNGEALSRIPPTVQAASKQGAVDASRSEVVLVNAPSGDYVFCVITKHQQDQSYDYGNEGYVLLRDVSALLWRHFEPGHPYSPPAGADSLVP